MLFPRAFALILLLGLATVAQAGDPVTFQEISLLLRSGQKGQDIVNETARRGLFQPLTPEQETTLRSQGASTDLLNALRTPSLLAPPEQVAAYAARHRIRLNSLPSSTQSAIPTRPTGPTLVTNLFPEGLEAAKKGVPRVMLITDAYRLDELPKAMARAQSERKPMGFIQVTGSMFAGNAFSSRLASNGPALVHFYEAFKDSLVLVFVRQETELNKVPAAVAAGFRAPGQDAVPNMAVVDATVSELIGQVPLGGSKATGEQRDANFKIAANRIYEWLTYHPTALGQAALPQN